MSSPANLEIRTSTEARRRFRIAITESCNLKCFFCHGDGGDVQHFSAQESTLLPSEIAEVIRLASLAGVKKVKLTGGEPLLYRSAEGGVNRAVEFAAAAAHEAKIDLSLVTNGISLTPQLAVSLRSAGLPRITISLHAGRQETFASYAGLSAGSRQFHSVVRGIRAAIDSGLEPVKVNTVVYYSASDESRRNLDELPVILDLCGQLGVSQVKFFVVLQSPKLAQDSHRDSFVFWTDRLLDQVIPSSALSGMRTLLKDKRLERFAAPGSFSATFDIGNEMPKISFQNLKLRAQEDGHSGACNCHEGAYSLRMTSRGELKACLWDREVKNLLVPLRAGDVETAYSMISHSLSKIHCDREVVTLASAA